jgi:hypothetical protein
MSNEPIDPETIAAFIDGRLEPNERAALLERLARDPEAFETFAEASAIERELAGIRPDVAGPAVAATENPEKFRTLKERSLWRYAIPLAAAAGIGAMLIGRVLLHPKTRPVLLSDSSTLLIASGAGTLESALGANWTEPAWTGTRGAASSLSSGQRAFRVGSRLAVLALAADARDAEAADRAAIELRELLSGVDGSAAIAARLDNIVGDVRSGDRSRDAIATLRDIASDLEALVPGVWLRAGAWVEQARLAAKAGSVEWFSPDGPAIAEARSLVTALRSEAPSNAQSTAAGLERVLGAIAPGRDREALTRLPPVLDAIAAEAAGR